MNKFTTDAYKLTKLNCNGEGFFTWLNCVFQLIEFQFVI
jgi:hypothetical protein